MSSRLVFESWQIWYPVAGFFVFAAIFAGVVVRVWRMKRTTADRLGSLPLEGESSRSASHARSE